MRMFVFIVPAALCATVFSTPAYAREVAAFRNTMTETTGNATRDEVCRRALDGIYQSGKSYSRLGGSVTAFRQVADYVRPQPRYTPAPLPRMPDVYRRGQD